LVNFCQKGLFENLSNVLRTTLFAENIEVDKWYELMKDSFNTDLSNSLFSDLFPISDLGSFSTFLTNKTIKPYNIGVDLPIYFGDPTSINRIMIVAMDPKRIAQEPGVFSLGSVFSLHTNEGRNTKKNDYWNFIEPMIADNLVYLTDIYKLYYESYIEVNNRQVHQVSNKDKTFIGKNTVPFNINKEILEKEIELVKPTKIIALGKEAASALKQIQDLKVKESEIYFMHNQIEYLFMPHIARTVTQNISTIANLFVAMGKLKNDQQLEFLGEQLKIYKEDLFN
jgi:uracil-DNA glycosylase